ncbi:magnesium protoporphyrin IX methyltransferase [Archangium violaceum]|uniref:magnesium protoporphyrin IX methyltransferase n=1 Tax=Archangium violaceum TaxID=83451 RepID=UPI002B305DA6|nr:magnesium protoporphyrin IX methyltransferase [Archangium violaceum]
MEAHDTVPHKDRLLTYFNGLGFERWSAIYGDSELSRVRRKIREGHAAMMTLAQQWLVETLRPDSTSPGRGSVPRVLDAGCGTGLLGVALAQQGLHVTAVDLAPRMVAEAERAASDAGVRERMAFQTGDLEHIEGHFDAVVSLDVLMHYPRPGFARLCTRLARLSRGPLLLTYSPWTPLFAVLHWLGGHLPHHHRRPDIHLLPTRFVEHTLAQAGMRIQRSARISHSFYHVVLLQAGREG